MTPLPKADGREGLVSAPRFGEIDYDPHITPTEVLEDQ